MRYVIIDKDALTARIKGDYSPAMLEGGKYILKVDSNNEDALTGYIKYNSEEIKSIIGLGFGPSFINNNQRLAPFSSSKTSSGETLYTRIMGVNIDVPPHNGDDANLTILKIDVPYNHCKWDTTEILTQDSAIEINAGVRDSDAGLYTSYPNYVLNQYAFNMRINRDNHYRYVSPYEANLYLDMQLYLEVKNLGTEASNIAVNFILHEVKND